jgi:hypothetical protein
LVSVVAARTATGLHMQAEDMGAELLVIGSSHRGALGRLMLGDDIRETINGAPCHVVVAARGYAAREARSTGSRTSAETSSEARLGDWIESRGIHGELAHHDGSVRRGQIVEILGPPEYVHYRVQWDERHDSIVYPDDGVLILSGSHNP